MTLYATTGNGLIAVEQQNDNWHARRVLALEGARCVAAHPNEPHTLYVGSEGKGVWKTTNGGQTWWDTDLPEAAALSIAVSAADGAVYAGCEPSKIYRSRDGGEAWHELEALRSIPSAPTWSFPPKPWTSHVRWIAPNPHDADLLLAGIELGGVMRSEDGGATWADHRPGAQPDCHALAWHPTAPNRAYEAGGGGAAWSHDAGQTWQRVDEGRDRHYTWALAVDPADPDCWYISANPGPRWAHHTENDASAYVYRWRGAGPWQALGGGLPQPLDSMVYALAAGPEQLFAGLRDGRLYLSRDGGDSWEAVPLSGEQPTRVEALAWVA